MGNNAHGYLGDTIEKTDVLLKDVEDALGLPKERRDLSYKAMRAVLHALRDRLTVGESAQLAAQLPTLVRGAFYEGWQPERVPVKLSLEQWLQRVHDECPLDVKGGTPRLVQAVLSALSRHVTRGEWDDVRASLPDEYSSMIP
ncbi:DUF2267 domain-containing protein [Phytohabitans suffuscus]|uniref:DUF2267 domain-containing protein n=1 Tax=Phytohabitans suffuscus TaxID=624315 RepID=A0A6F8YVY7_9ACTN|nr:DUF2267 domain-containing protein [Phytohabitans suffuscus]BCB90216.1 hypothetical protein Psuf_075290 [Phytohabitans suffuscus]